MPRKKAEAFRTADLGEVAVLVPCYNEAVTIAKVVDDFHRCLPDATVYVYDNNSTDGTAKIAREHGAVVRREPRQGKGRVVRQMIRDIRADYSFNRVFAACMPVLSPGFEIETELSIHAAWFVFSGPLCLASRPALPG